MAKGALTLGFLGSVEVARAGLALALPPSKKTRALLAYLVLTGRPHRRERLCSLFWDVTDDPRGALRWSLSKLRTLVDDERHKRIIADRDQVEFHAYGAEVDVLRVRECLGRGLEGAPTEAITSCLGYFRGELLEGLDLPDFDDFQAWCIAEREELRRLHARALAEMVKRLADDPNGAVAHARACWSGSRRSRRIGSSRLSSCSSVTAWFASPKKLGPRATRSRTTCCAPWPTRTCPNRAGV